MPDARPHVLRTSIHGRYLVDAPSGRGPFPVLLGFHGYGEAADAQLAQLARIDPQHQWLRVSVQGLHRFYAKGDRVVASWMTREDRDLAIADNVRYADEVRGAVGRDYPAQDRCVVVGFSQGAAQAYRAALAAGSACAGVIVLGGDLPPDVAPRAATLPPVLVGQGARDEWYTASKLDADLAALRAAGTVVDVCTFDAGHEWAAPFVARAAEWLAGR
jgi:predicted esterase